MQKTAIVTGAASGIGLAVARALARQGIQVIVADLDRKAGRQAADEMGGRFVAADLSQREACRALVDSAAEHEGGVDILVNNAGFQHISPIEDFDEDAWVRLLQVMLTAPFLLTRYAWPHMRKRGWGRIVNMASVHALVASPNKAGYITAKHGLLGLTRTAALEGGPAGITVNAICPAYVRTPLVENQIAAQAKSLGISEDEVLEKVFLKASATGRLIEPEEIAELVLYLCSDAAKSVTGSCFTIDGGWTAQ